MRDKVKKRLKKLIILIITITTISMHFQIICKTHISDAIEIKYGDAIQYQTSNLRVEKQGDSGWCWAYASLKCLEIYLQKNKNIDYNFAEYHLAYMRLKEFGGWKDDIEKNGQANFSSLEQAAYKLGGNFEDFMKYVGVYSSDFSIKGPIVGEEKENKEYSFSNENKTSFAEEIPTIKVTKSIQFGNISKTYDSDGTVTYINGKKELTSKQIAGFRSAVKEQIKNNGAVYAIIDMDTSDLNNNTYSLYTNEDNIQKCHAVTIVGWDDGYKASNFNEEKTPKNDGAWIALNSWGEDFGNNGLFYISYDDAIVEKYMCGVLEAESYTNEPSVKISYEKNNNGSIKVIISSNERLEKPDDSWSLKYDEYYNTTYFKVRTTSSTLEKTFYSNVNKVVTINDNSGAKVNVTINIDSIDQSNFGDINGDNKVDLIDLLLLKRHLIAGNNSSWKLQDKALEAGDINGDGKITITDLLLLKKVLLNSK